MLFPRLWAAPVERFFRQLDPGSLDRGVSYALGGRVRTIDPGGDASVRSAVEGSGSQRYHVLLELAKKNTGVIAECSCPVGYACKHGVAAALILVEALWRVDPILVGGVMGSLPAEWLARRQLVPIPPAMMEKLANWAGAEIEERASKPALAPKPKPKPKRATPPVAWFEAALDAKDDHARDAVYAKELRRRVKHLSNWETDTFIRNLRSTPNPIDQLGRFEELAWGVERHYMRDKTPPDAELALFLRSDRAAEISRRFELERAENDLLGWLSQAKGETLAPTDHIEARWIALGGGSGIQELRFEILLTSKKLRREPRHAQQIAQLAKEAQYNKRVFLPEQARFLQWVEPQVRHVDQRESLFAVRDAVSWLALWSDYGLMRWENDAPVVFNPAPAWIEAALPEGGGPPEIVVRSAPQSPARPLREVALLCEPADARVYGYGVPAPSPRLFVRDGNVIARLETRGAPVRAIAAMRTLPALPLERIRQSGAADIFASRLSSLAPKVPAPGDPAVAPRDPLADEIPVAPRVELRLVETENEFDVVAYADAADGRVFDCAGPGRWRLRQAAQGAAPFPPPETDFDGPPVAELIDPGAPSPEEGAPSADAGPEPAPNPYAILLRPRASDVEALDRWLYELVPPGCETGIDAQDRTHPYWKATPQAIADFIRLWPLRPKGVKYLGNPALQRLTQPMAAPRFRVNVRSHGVNWFEVDVDWEEELRDLSADEMLKALRAQSEGELVLLPGGRAVKRKDLERLEQTMEAVGALGLEPGRASQRVHLSQLAAAASEPLLAAGEALEELRPLTDKVREAAASFEEIPNAPLLKGIGKILRPYQRHGVDFLVWAGETFGGALLADEMGLGKTLQTLAALWALRSKAGKDAKPSIVFCPASVVHNWEREAKRFFPGFKTLTLQRGAARQRQLKTLGKHHLIITNYALARIEAEALHAQEWLMACVDEAQAIKNPKSGTAMVVKGLSAQYRFALTGTPIENRLSDLGSIMEFALPGHLAPLGGIERLAAPNPPDRLRKTLRARLRPVLLRRLKAEVAPELPERIEERLDCAMTPAQRVSYLAELKRARATLERAEDDRIVGPSRIQILAALTRLRQICCDPALVGLPATGSGKVEALVELLNPVLESGHKILVFSQFVKMLDRLRPRLEKEGIRCHYLSGKTTNRKDVVDAFQADPKPCVFLVSLKAGGSGLNLTAASHVVLFDPWWNPAVEAQAIDRTHRIGQDKTVIATRLVTEGTIEERILQLQEKKRGLMKAVLEEESFNRALTRDDFEFLLGGAADAEADTEELA